MEPRTLEQRVAALEQQVHEWRELPDRVDRLELQIMQLRDEMRVEFSAIRSELREDIRIGVEESQNLAKLLHADAIQATADVREDVMGRLLVLRNELSAEIRDGNAETRAFMRALHQETLTMIATMGKRKKGRKSQT